MRYIPLNELEVGKKYLHIDVDGNKGEDPKYDIEGVIKITNISSDQLDYVWLECYSVNFEIGDRDFMPFNFYDPLRPGWVFRRVV